MKFKPPSQSFTIRDYLFIAVAVLLFIGVSSWLISFNYNLKGGGEFYVHWVASRGFIFEKIDPYSAEIPARVQSLAYDHAARAGEKPYLLDTPFHLVLFYFPFVLFSDPLAARAVYLWLLELMLIPLAWFSLRLTDWEAPLGLWVFFIGLCMFNFYSVQALFDTSPIIILGLFYAGILFALRYEMDEVAGALMAASFYHWEAGAPFLLLVALRAYRQKRTGVLYGFLMLAVVSLIVSFLLYANWLIPFLRTVANNLRAGFGYNLRDILSALFPVQGHLLAWVVIVILLLALVYEWSIFLLPQSLLAESGIAGRDADFRRFYWTACLALAAAPLLSFRSEMADLSVLVIPLALIFAVVYDRWLKINKFLVLLLMLFVFLVPWSLSLLASQVADDLIFLFLPVFTVIGLYWIRWWAIRPPRIWTDLAPRL